MGNKKNIDKLFQKQFKNFNETPNHIIWEQLKNNLETNANKKRKALPFWMYFGSIAAGIAILITPVVQQFTAKKPIPNVVTTTKNRTNANQLLKEKRKIKETQTTISKTSLSKKNTENLTKTINNFTQTKTNTHKNVNNTNNSIANNTTTLKNKNWNTNLLKKITAKNNNYQNTFQKKKTNLTNNTLFPRKNIKNNTIILIAKQITTPNNNALSKKTSPLSYQKENNTPKNNITIVNTLTDKTLQKNTTKKNVFAVNLKEKEKLISKKKKTIEEAILEKKNEGAEEVVNNINSPLNKWDISTNIAPVYYNTLSSGSPLDNQFIDNKKTGEVNASYGINASYKINRKLKIRTGIHKLELSYNTQNVAVLPISIGLGNGAPDLRGLTSSNGISLNITNGNNYTVSQIPEAFDGFFSSNLNQRFGYLEVPLEVSYALFVKKITINVIGGFSSFFLNKNEVYAETNNNKIYLGKGNNLNNISFSSNIGVGFSYHLSKKIAFNMEPTFKYQLNSFTNDSGNFKPYILGIYTGLSFKF